MSKYLIENLFGIDGWNIAWYGVIIAVGMVLGVMLAIYRVGKQGLKEELIFDFILIALPVAIICARGYYPEYAAGVFRARRRAVYQLHTNAAAARPVRNRHIYRTQATHPTPPAPRSLYPRALLCRIENV